MFDFDVVPLLKGTKRASARENFVRSRGECSEFQRSCLVIAFLGFTPHPTSFTMYSSGEDRMVTSAPNFRYEGRARDIALLKTLSHPPRYALSIAPVLCASCGMQSTSGGWIS